MKYFKKYLISVIAGITAGLITLFIIPGQYEILIWLVLIIVLGIIYSKMFQQRLFLYAFAFSVLVGIIITIVHLSFVDVYLENHQDEMATLEDIKIYNSYRLTLMMIAPVYWLILGILSAFSALLFKKFQIIKVSKM
ncbi:hypothetical protein QQ020_28250 [Fulvivirgaceae bacterium BMA12]|uniref:Uncharacterized protein n=1 Tax=Agaribacillus aureus TaxID=3051825 RepID=A0ABT8LIB3_9BACT|nr:hypothetical protein [Fulvivirgaceae bacterium BMA12]